MVMSPKSTPCVQPGTGGGAGDDECRAPPSKWVEAMCSQAHGLGDGAKQSLGHTGCQALSILSLYPHTALPVRRFLYPSLAGEKQAREVKSLAQGGPVGTEGAANVSCVLCCHSAISGVWFFQWSCMDVRVGL